MSGEQVRASGSAGRKARLARFVAVFGPGLVVMLADTDVGSIITAGQSGVQWGYRLLLLQIVLMPVLFGVVGAAMVVSLACAWGFGEVTGYRHSLQHHPLEA